MSLLQFPYYDLYETGLKYRGFSINIESNGNNYYWSIVRRDGYLVEVGRVLGIQCRKPKHQALEDAKTAVDVYLVNLKIVLWQNVIAIEAEKSASHR